MNEKQFKKISVSLCLLMFVAIIFAQSVIDNRAIRRADTEIDTLERELADARRRVEECGRQLEDSTRTIEQCYNSVGRIADTVSDQSTQLQSIIANLRTVREEVKNMENALNFFYIKYGIAFGNTDNTGGELE